MLGADVVDFPKLEFAYDSYPAECRGELYGHGFSLYCTLPDTPIDRNRAFRRALAGEFQLVVFADITSAFGSFVQLAPMLTDRARLAVLDGADRAVPYPYAGMWWRKREWWALPRAHPRALYFKRELSGLTGMYRAYLMLPPRLAARLPSVKQMREIAFSLPEDKIVRESPRKKQLLATHCVDPEVARRCGIETSYAFTAESAYYADLQASRYGVTTKRAGWDCLRHYEFAANGCVPCFRDLDRKPERSAPHGLNETNCIGYHNAEELLRRLDTVDDASYRTLQEGAISWAHANTTRVRALQFLRVCGIDLDG